MRTPPSDQWPAGDNVARDMSAAIIDSRFRFRRTQNWLLLGFLYALFYMSRYNYSATSAYLDYTAEDKT